MVFTGFQTWIGQVDVKSSSVNFYVQRSSDYSTINTPISFDVVRLNVGGAMNTATGKFTAPRNGIYSFSFTGLGQLAASSSRVVLDVAMYLNGNIIGRGVADETGTADQYETTSFQSTLNLQKGDQIWLEIWQLSSGMYLRGQDSTHFSGYLLEENLSQSLNVKTA